MAAMSVTSTPVDLEQRTPSLVLNEKTKEIEEIPDSLVSKRGLYLNETTKSIEFSERSMEKRAGHVTFVNLDTQNRGLKIFFTIPMSQAIFDIFYHNVGDHINTVITEGVVDNLQAWLQTQTAAGVAAFNNLGDWITTIDTNLWKTGGGSIHCSAVWQPEILSDARNQITDAQFQGIKDLIAGWLGQNGGQVITGNPPGVTKRDVVTSDSAISARAAKKGLCLGYQGFWRLLGNDQKFPSKFPYKSGC